MIAVLADKDAEGLLANLSGIFERAVITQSTSVRSMPIADLEPVASSSLDCDVLGFSDFRAGLARAQEIASEVDGTVVVTGSITLVGDVIKLIQEESDAQ